MPKVKTKVKENTKSSQNSLTPPKSGETKKAPTQAFKRKFDILQQLKQEGIIRDPRKCIHKRAGRFCERWAIAGGTVCPKHGGSAPQVKRAAQLRMNEMLLRKIERLDEISEQDMHMPSALGATQSIINRVMGKVGEAPKKENSGPVIQIGISLSSSGSTPKIAAVGVAQLPSVGKSDDSDNSDVIDADYDIDE